MRPAVLGNELVATVQLAVIVIPGVRDRVRVRVRVGVRVGVRVTVRVTVRVGVRVNVRVRVRVRIKLCSTASPHRRRYHCRRDRPRP